MYAVGDYLVKAGTGVCQVSEIGHPAFQSAKESRLFYTLIPVGDSKTRLYIPTEPETVGLRAMLPAAEARALIREIPQIAPLCIENDKQREQQYKQTIHSNDLRQLAAMVKALYLRDQDRTAQGKKSLTVDTQYFQRAEKLLCAELALALGAAEQDIPDMIQAELSAQQG